MNTNGILLWNKAIRTYSVPRTLGGVTHYAIHIDVPVRFHDKKVVEKVKTIAGIGHTIDGKIIRKNIDQAIQRQLIKTYDVTTQIKLWEQRKSVPEYEGVFVTPMEIDNWGYTEVSTIRPVITEVSTIRPVINQPEIYALWVFHPNDKNMYTWVHNHHDWLTEYPKG